MKGRGGEDSIEQSVQIDDEGGEDSIEHSVQIDDEVEGEDSI